MDPKRLQRLLSSIDQLNAEDPNQVVFEAVKQAQELAYAKRLTAWVLRLCPSASEYLRIAARGQHVRRWTIPRESYPRTREGYLRWREALKAFHAKTVTDLMRQEGYSPQELERVATLILKRPAAEKAELQALEDALCLIFLETQLAETRAKVPDEKMREVVRKTWRKMSADGHREALALPLAPDQRAWLSEIIQ